MKRIRETVLLIGVLLLVGGAMLFDFRWGLIACGAVASSAALIGMVRS
jgi:hypothetical protein